VSLQGDTYVVLLFITKFHQEATANSLKMPKLPKVPQIYDAQTEPFSGTSDYNYYLHLNVKTFPRKTPQTTFSTVPMAFWSQHLICSQFFAKDTPKKAVTVPNSEIITLYHYTFNFHNTIQLIVLIIIRQLLHKLNKIIKPH